VHFEQALQIKRAIGDREGEGANLTNLGAVYGNLGDYPQALAHYEQALSIMRAIGVPAGIEEANMGDIYLAQGKLKKALAVFKRLNTPIRLGRYYLRTGEYHQAREEFARSLKVDEEQRNADFLLADYIGLGLALEGLQEYGRAREAYQKAVEFIERQREGLAEPQRRRFFAATVKGFSRMEPYEGLARTSSKLNQTREGLLYAEHTKSRMFLYAIAKRYGEGTFNIPRGLAQQEEELTTKVASLYKQQELAFQKKNQDRYQEIEKELKRVKDAQQKLITTLRKQYPEYASLRYPQPIGLEEIALQKDELLLEYEVTEQETLVWVVKKGEILKTLRIPITRADLEELVKQYRKFSQTIAQEKSDAAFRSYNPKLGAQLYNLLLKDLLPFLSPDKKLIIVPDEILGILPFEMLVAELPEQAEIVKGQFSPHPRGVSYLGDKYTISYYQSATALTTIRSLKKRIGTQPLLMVADPVFNSSDERLKGKKTQLAQRDAKLLNLMRPVEEWRGGSVFPRLKITGQLAARLKPQYGKGMDVLSGLTATEPELRRRALKDYRYQVYATHGILDGQVPYIQEPALVLSQIGVNAQEGQQDGFWTLSEVMEAELNAEIVALIACETGVGKNVAGEGVMGMGRAFQYAGAKAVLISLWSVAEESTVLLTEKFFTYLKQGQNKLEALRQARADIRQAGYEHPFYWALFILVGER
jgi:CHAT domain-containing protein